MSNHKTRLQKLEKQSGTHAVYKYMCLIDNRFHWVSPEEAAKGYKIQPYIQSAGGNGGEPFYLATWEDVQAFEARPDVNLTIVKIEITPASEAIAKQNNLA